MRMGNPYVRHWVSKLQRCETDVDAELATYKGVYSKSALFAIITVAFCVATEFILMWTLGNGYAEQTVIALSITTVVCAIAMFIMAIVISFVPTLAKILGIIYSVLQGCLLGTVSMIADLFYPGVAFSAFLGTVVVFLVSLAVNKLFAVKISSGFVRGLIVVLFSLVACQFVVWLMSFTGVFGDNFTVLWWIQLAISAVCIIWATIMLMWDLQSVDVLVHGRADKRYEWNVAFSLVTTLVYMYLEILELILRLAMIFGKKKN